MRRPITFLCDIDEVVAALLDEWLRRYNAASGDTLTLDAVISWNMNDVVLPEWQDRIYDFLHDPTLYDSIEPVAGAHEGIDRLRTLGASVVYVSSCVGSEMAKAKLDWMVRHRFTRASGRFSFPDIILATDKSLICGDVLLDDYPRHLDLHPDPNLIRLLWDRPYNLSSPHRRVRSWSEVLTTMELLWPTNK